MRLENEKLNRPICRIEQGRHSWICCGGFLAAQTDPSAPWPCTCSIPRLPGGSIMPLGQTLSSTGPSCHPLPPPPFSSHPSWLFLNSTSLCENRSVCGEFGSPGCSQLTVGMIHIPKILPQVIFNPLIVVCWSFPRILQWIHRGVRRERPLDVLQGKVGLTGLSSGAE